MEKKSRDEQEINAILQQINEELEKLKTQKENKDIKNLTSYFEELKKYLDKIGGYNLYRILEKAVKTKDLKLVELCCEKLDKYLDKIDGYDLYRFLEKAVETNNLEIVELCYEKLGKYPDKIDKHLDKFVGSNLYLFLEKAIETNNLEIVELCCEKLEKYLDKIHDYGLYCIFRKATKTNNIEIFKLCCEKLKEYLHKINDFNLYFILKAANSIKNQEAQLEVLIPMLGSKNPNLKSVSNLQDAINIVYGLLQKHGPSSQKEKKYLHFCHRLLHYFLPKYEPSSQKEKNEKEKTDYIIGLCEGYVKNDEKTALNLMLVSTQFFYKITLESTPQNYPITIKVPNDKNEKIIHKLPSDCLGVIFEFIIFIPVTSPLPKLKFILQLPKLLETRPQIVEKKKSEKSFVQKEEERKRNEGERTATGERTEEVIKIPEKTTGNRGEGASPLL